MAFQTVNIDEPPRRHPVQINELPGPKGAYEMKKIENGYYLRIDMPGVSPPHLKVIRENERKEIRFQGFAKNVTELLSLKDSSRLYVVIVKVEECQDFDRVVVEHQIKNGTCRILITGVDYASLNFRTPTKSSGSSSSSKDSKAVVNEKPSAMSSHPYSVRIDGISMKNRHSDDCTCCHGEKGEKTLNGPLSEEDGRIYGYIAPEVMGAFETKFKAAENGSGDYNMYFRMDMPDCSADYMTEKCIHMIEEGRVVVAWHSDLSEFDDKFKLDSDGGRRNYCCQLTLPCGINCCAFDYGKIGSKAVLSDGVFRAYCKIKKISNQYMEHPSAPIDSRLLQSERPYSEPPDDSGPCSTSATMPERMTRGGASK